MTDLSTTISPKSDQLNSDDLIAGPRTITITRVTGNPESKEQPISVFFDGDNGKPYKPCLSMRRLMVWVWDADGTKYPGRSMTLYRDPDVTWGGLKVGGIRISHMTDIDKPVVVALTATKQSRKPFTVQPLDMAKPGPDPIDTYAREVGQLIKTMDINALSSWWIETAERRDGLKIPADRLEKMTAAVNAKLEGKE